MRIEPEACVQDALIDTGLLRAQAPVFLQL